MWHWLCWTVNNRLWMLCERIITVWLLYDLTLGTHAQQGLQYSVCLTLINCVHVSATLQVLWTERWNQGFIYETLIDIGLYISLYHAPIIYLIMMHIESPPHPPAPAPINISCILHCTFIIKRLFPLAPYNIYIYIYIYIHVYRDENGCTPLCLVGFSGSIQVAKLLIEKNASVNPPVSADNERYVSACSVFYIQIVSSSVEYMLQHTARSIYTNLELSIYIQK